MENFQEKSTVLLFPIYSSVTLIILNILLCQHCSYCLLFAQVFNPNFTIVVPSHCVKSVFIWSYSGPYFPTFGLNTYSVQSKCGKRRTRITPNTYTFYAVSVFGINSQYSYFIEFPHSFYFLLDKVLVTSFVLILLYLVYFFIVYSCSKNI